jgi:hypothetical protein
VTYAHAPARSYDRCPVSRGSVCIAPPSARHDVVPRALLAAAVATPSAAPDPRRYCRRRSVLGHPDPPLVVEALLPRGRVGVGGGGVQCRSARVEPRPAAGGRRHAAVRCRRHLPHQRTERRYVTCRGWKRRYVTFRGWKRRYLTCRD